MAKRTRTQRTETQTPTTRVERRKQEKLKLIDTLSNKCLKVGLIAIRSLLILVVMMVGTVVFPKQAALIFFRGNAYLTSQVMSVFKVIGIETDWMKKFELWLLKQLEK